MLDNITDLHLAQTSCNGSNCKVDACADLTGVFDEEDLVPRPCITQNILYYLVFADFSCL